MAEAGQRPMAESDGAGVLLGITGGVGSGKSTFARLLSGIASWPVLDGDRLGHEALLPGAEPAGRVVARFGRGILNPDGSIDRGALARAVFAREDALRDLNRITHPWILDRIEEEVVALREQARADIIVLDAAVLPLWLHTLRRRHRLWVVVIVAPLLQRLARLSGRGLSRPEALERMRRQASVLGPPRRSEWIVENGGTSAELESAARKVARQVQAARGSRKIEEDE